MKVLDMFFVSFFPPAQCCFHRVLQFSSVTKISNLGTLLHGFYEKTLLVSQQILCNTIIPLRGMTAKQHEEWGAANTKTRENLGSIRCESLGPKLNS